MFSIRFVDEPAYVWDGTGPLTRDAMIVLDDFEERFEVHLDSWSEAEYERPWQEGVLRIVGGERSSCLVTRMHDPDCSPILRWWSLYRREGQTVAVREQLWLPEFGRVDPKDPYGAVRAYEEDDDPEISEWDVTVDDLIAFASDA